MGFSIIEIALGMAVVGIVIIAGSQMTNRDAKNDNQLANRHEVLELKNFLRRSISCEKTVPVLPATCSNNEVELRNHQDQPFLPVATGGTIPKIYGYQVQAKCLPGTAKLIQVYARKLSTEAWQPIFQAVPFTCKGAAPFTDAPICTTAEVKNQVPTLIHDQTELAAMTNDKRYELANDVTLSGNWDPKSYKNFILDGKGFTIRGLKSKASLNTPNSNGMKHASFLGNLNCSAVVDLKIENAEIDQDEMRFSGGSGGTGAAILAILAINTVIKDIEVSGTVNTINAAGLIQSAVGNGIYPDYTPGFTQISNARANVTFNCNARDSSFSSGASPHCNAYGFVSSLSNDVRIINLVGNFTFNTSAVQTTRLQAFALFGIFWSFARITGSEIEGITSVSRVGATATVTGETAFAAVDSFNEGTIRQSFVRATFDTQTKSNGFFRRIVPTVGRTSPILEDSYFIAKNYSQNLDTYAGALARVSPTLAANSIRRVYVVHPHQVANEYSPGHYFAGFVNNENNPTATIVDSCYWDIDRAMMLPDSPPPASHVYNGPLGWHRCGDICLNPPCTSRYLTAGRCALPLSNPLAYPRDRSTAQSKTTAQLRTQATFVGWDFVNVWRLPAGDTPKLRWEP